MAQARISKQQVKETARMASLAMSEEELAEYTTNMANLLGLVAQIDGVNTENVEPMAHPLDLNQIFHDDLVFETKIDQAPEAFTKIAPAFEDGYFLVPKVIDDID